MSRPVVILGGPGGGEIAAHVIASIADAGGDVDVLGYLNDVLPVGHTLLLGSVLGPFEAWVDLPDDVQFIAPLHKVHSMQAVVDRIDALGIDERRWATLIDPSASIAPNVTIGGGCLVAAHASLQPGARLGRHVAVRHGALIGHDSAVGDFGFVGANAVLCGRVTAETAVFVAPNATVRNDIRLGAYATAGLGCVVVNDVAAGVVVAGNPARPITQEGSG